MTGSKMNDNVSNGVEVSSGRGVTNPKDTPKSARLASSASRVVATTAEARGPSAGSHQLQP